MLLGIPKLMIPWPLLWDGAVRAVGSHVGRIPNCSKVPDPRPPPPPLTRRLIIRVGIYGRLERRIGIRVRGHQGTLVIPGYGTHG